MKPAPVPEPPEAPTQAAAGPRLAALDAFRGATMALMVLVNNPGDGAHTYAPLLHAEWHGWTVTDVVFPSFIWIVGVAIMLAFARRLAAGAPRGMLFLQALRRGAILYGLGLAVYAFPHFNPATFRVLGVLQRIATCYVAAAAIYLTCRVRGQLVWLAGLLGVYWLIMMLAPVPGYGAGRLDVEGNFAHYIDSLVLGRHNYAPTRTWDPEGIVSTLPAIATAIFGLLAGRVVTARRVLTERTTWLFLIGNLLIACGLICDAWLPINKKLWTTSFALFMAGLDFVVLAIFVWCADGLGRRKFFKPAIVMGMNAITVYMVSELLDSTLNAVRWGTGTGSVSLRVWLYRTLFAPLAAPRNASLLYALAYTLLMYGVAWAMYRRKWFVRV